MSGQDIEANREDQSTTNPDHEVQELRYIADRLDTLFAQQKQKIEDLDVLIVGHDREQKKNQQAFVDSLKKTLSEHKKIAEETKALFQDTRNDTQELRRIAILHQQKLSSYYDYLFLKILGIAAMGGMLAIVIMQIVYGYLIPLIHRWF
jgi:flagellar biosynthesis chaperone FliJ